MAGVKLTNVKKSFGDVHVIHGVDLEIEDGDFVVLSGSRALRDAGHRTNYAAGHKRELTAQETLVPEDDTRFFRFARDCPLIA